mmetsp:Transcript_18636/g.39148  ORF Transcript_18636/g.39148 Transcript_18636/m.39148 type:complete len:172 (-) Transcript_18636:218-733(-)
MVFNGLKCLWCGATETPLWRSGPAGPKTLCNACGVRFTKTGRQGPTERSTRGRKGKGKGNASKDGSITKRNVTRGARSQGNTQAAIERTESLPEPSTPTEPSTEGPSTLPVQVSTPPPRPYLSPIVEEYLNGNSKCTAPIAVVDKTNYRWIFAGLMVVQRSTRRRVRRPQE